MELTREQINEANFPYEKIKARVKAIKDELKTIEAAKMESDVRKPGMPASLAKEVATKITGPIISLRKKLEETVDNKDIKPTDNLKANTATRKKIEQIERELKTIKSNSVKLTEKVAEALSKSKVDKMKHDSSQAKTKSKYETGQKKKEQEQKFVSGRYAAESVDFKKRVRSYLSLDEMATSVLQKLEEKHKSGKLPDSALQNSQVFKQLIKKFKDASSKADFKKTLTKEVSDKFAERIITNLIRASKG